MRRLGILGVLVVTLGACLFEPVPGKTEFVVPAGAIQVAEGVYLAFGSEVSGPLPQPSSDPSAPVIVAAHYEDSGTNAIALVLSVATSIAIERVHLEIDGRHYAASLSGGTTTLDACSILQQQQGYGCTAACVDACGCLECDSDMIESNAEGACAASCSTTSQQGALSAPPYNGSEVTFADVVYNGWTDPQGGGSINGIIASFPGCSAAACASAAAAEKTVYIEMYYQDYSFIQDFDIGSAVAETQPSPSKPSMASNNFGTGTLNPPRVCDPGACPR